jgi:hypothetical protein
MTKQNFKAIGRIPGECIFVHPDDVLLLKEDDYPAKVQCIGIDFITGQISEPAIIDVLLKFVPHDIICSEGEREVILDLVGDIMTASQVEALNKQFEEIRLQG